jgi:non-specific serine/threonine protein kinase
MNPAVSLYFAPELLSGQPFTVKSDIYALGVILYQFLTGDFGKVMSPGWERDIDDELLREDIALVTEENPAMRLADADSLARRLRTLDERRGHLIAQREAQAQAERVHRGAEHIRVRRAGIAFAFAVLTIGLAISTAQYYKAHRAQEQNAIAAAQSKVVAEFLGNEVLAPARYGVEPAKEPAAIERLMRAGDEIDLRFAGQPAVAAELHYVIGRSFARLQEYPPAARHFNRAMELGQPLEAARADPVLRSASALVEIDYILGKLRQSVSRYEAVLSAAEGGSAPNDAALLELRAEIARGRYRLGDWSQAAQALESVLRIQGTSSSPSESIGRTELYLGEVLTDLAKSADAEIHLRQAVDVLSRAVGPMRAEVAEARASLGRSLIDAGQYDDAAAELDRAQALATRSAPANTWIAVMPRYFRALLFLRQDRPEEAEPILVQIIDSNDAHLAAYVQAHQVSPPEADRTGPVRQALGEAYALEGKFDAATVALRRAVAVGERADGAQHPGTLSTRLSLAECLVAEGRDAEARAVLTNPTMDLSALPAVHPIAAQLARVNGLLAQHEGNMEQARKWLGDSLAVLQSLYGAQHWRVVSARQELERTASQGSDAAVH